MQKLKFIVILIPALLSVNFGLAQVGINTTQPLSTLDINGNLSVKTITLVGSGSATDINDGVYISINPQATNQEFRLPSAVTYPGRVYIIRNINNTTTAMLTSTAGLLFPKGSTTGSAQVYMYEGNRRSVIVISDGSNWTYFD
ncbi:hypothetical protein WMW71_02150 [Flavobacterium buctense]|uniref:IPT/TIG domain-containing protein n=1 Tax=Flavobacterium buctense TaxID=1648146 RepID=A0ABU9DZM6_9FLAO|nr:hypothetical protein [Flavobacterium buctense]